MSIALVKVTLINLFKPTKSFQRGFIKLGKNMLVTLMITISALFSTAMVFLSLPSQSKPVEAAWFNDNWSYRKAITLTDSGAESQKYATLASFNASDTSKYQSECGDVRFTDQSGKLLPYTVSSCGASTTFHINLSSIINGSQTIYLYYGNPSAADGFVSADPYSACSGCSFGSPASEEKGTVAVAYWKFDDAQGTVAKDASTNANDGTLGGSTVPTWKAEDLCLSGKCLYFDGSASKVTGSKSALGVKTVAFWVRPNAIATQGLLTLNEASSTRTLATNGSGVISATNFSSPTYYINGQATTSPTLVANRWNYVVVVTSTGVDSGTAIKIGTDGTNYTKGFLDEVKLFNNALSAAQVAANYNARQNPDGVSAQLGGSIENEASALSNGLVGYWKMDESSPASLVDSSGNGLTATRTGTAYDVATGRFGNSMSGTGNGASDYYSFTNTNLGTSNTVAYWVKFNSTAGSNSYVLIGSATNGNYASYIDFGGNLWYYSPSNGNNVSVSIAGLFSTNTWYHLAISRSENSVTFYKDGVRLGTTQTLSTNSSLTVGSLFNHKPAATGFALKGAMDDVRLYNRALSSSEISQLYNWAPGPVGYWKMDEGSWNGTAGEVIDSSGNGNNGTAANGPTTIQGKYGKAGSFDGSNDYVAIGDPSSGILDMGTNSFTIETWVYRQSGITQTYISKMHTGAAVGYRFDSDTNGALYATIQDGTNSYSEASANGVLSTSPTNGPWIHLAAVIDARNSITLYYNGVKLSTSGTGTLSSVASISSGNNFNLGATGNSGTNNRFRGRLDDVRIYNYARTQSQVIEDMNGGHPAPGSPVGSAVAYWQMDEGYGTTAHDMNSSTAGAEDLTLSTATSSWTDSGKFGKAFSGGGARWLSRVDDDALDFAASDNFSISMWMKSSIAAGGNPAATEYLLNKGPSGATNGGYALYGDTSGHVCFGVDDDNTSFPEDSVCSSSDVYDNAWHHLTAVKTGTTRMDLFVDGLANGTPDTSIASSVNTLANSSTFYLADKDGVDNGNEFNGSLDEVKIFRSALTSDQISLDINRGAAQVLGATSANSSNQPNSAINEYCVPGDTAACSAPIGRWDFDEGSGTSAQDSSGNGNTGTITAGSGGYVNGKLNKSYRFDNASTKIDAGSASSLDDIATTGSQDLTAEAWIYPKSTGEGGASGGVILGKATGPTGGNANGTLANGWVLFLTTSNALVFKVDAATTDLRRATDTTAGNTVTLNAWNHVAVTWDGTATATNVHIYINGQEANSYATSQDSSGAINSDATPSLIIGNDSTSADTFDGSIDHVLVYNYARSPSQIVWDYNKGGPVGWWKMDECQGASLFDNSGNGNTLTITIGGFGTNTGVGNCQTTASTSFWYSGVAGKRNYSGYFDGSGDYAEAVSAPSLNPTSGVSTSVWVKATADPAFSYVVDKNLSYSLNFDNTDTIDFHTSGVSNGDLHSNTVITTGLWYHIVETYDGAAKKIYVNGLLDSSISATGSLTTNSSVLSIGRPSGANNNYFPGQLDDVRVYNYGLTQTQVKTLYDEGAVRFGPAAGAP